jgi:hypothetical protein
MPAIEGHGPLVAVQHAKSDARSLLLASPLDNRIDQCIANAAAPGKRRQASREQVISMIRSTPLR